MAGRKIKVGFIGAGRISTLHRIYYECHDDAELVAICDINKKTALKKAAEWGINEENVYTNHEKLLKRDDIDAVEVLTPHSRHKDQVIAACEHGKHVSVQKVPCLSLSEFDAMQRAARKAGVKLKIYENFQFHEPYRRALEIIKSGIIGKPLVVNYRMWSSIKALSSWKVPIKAWRWRISERENFKMPTLFDDGYHKHNVIQLFLDKKIYSVQAWNKRFRIYNLVPMDIPAVVSYKTNGYEYGLWNTSVSHELPIKSDYYGCDEAVEIQCQKGIIWVNGCTGNMFADKNCGVGRPGVHWIDSKGQWHSELDFQTNWKYSFIACTNDFIKSIIEDREPYRSGDDARHVLQVNLAVVASIRSWSTEIKINQIKDGLPKGLEENEIGGDMPDEQGMTADD
ncbi:MAG: Gfo/Idh/MocA family protein [Promethearchaeota archaeon]